MSSVAETPSKPAIILDADEEKQTVSVGVDIDGDGKADFERSFTISDPRVWAIIGWIVAGVSIARNLNIW